MRVSALSIVLMWGVVGCGSSDESGRDSGGSRSMTQPPSTMPSAGSAAPSPSGSMDEMPPAGAAGGAAPSEPTPMEPMGEGVPYAMDECDLDTGFAGDEYCILPPPPDQGFQLHIGPTDYDNPDPRYILQPGVAMGGDVTSNFSAVASNDQDIHFLFRQFRMRPGAHHMIISQGSAAEGPGSRRIGTANASGDSPPGGLIAPENQGVGIPLAANATINVSLHSINVTDQPVLREIWVNFWYRDPSVVTESATQLFASGDPSFVVQPGESTVLGPYRCNVNGMGRMLWFYGHRHANNTRFSAFRVRGAQRDIFYDAYHWEEPLWLEYNTLVENPVPDWDAGIEGGWSGILDLQAGDQLEWECHVTNNNDVAVSFSNETYLGEMCIMDAELVGATCSGGGFGGFGTQ